MQAGLREFKEVSGELERLYEDQAIYWQQRGKMEGRWSKHEVLPCQGYGAFSQVLGFRIGMAICEIRKAKWRKLCMNILVSCFSQLILMNEPLMKSSFNHSLIMRLLLLSLACSLLNRPVLMASRFSFTMNIGIFKARFYPHEEFMDAHSTQ